MTKLALRYAPFAMATLLWAAPVFGQNGESPAVGFQETEPSETQRVLEEIVVTAQKRTERLIDVPVSVATISGQELQERALETLSDVSLSIPNVVAMSDAAVTQFYVRGMGTTFESNTDPSVVFIVDDVYFSDRVIATDLFLDVERIEFLRGPQGTLFGKNTIAGAINIATQAPSDDWEFLGQASIGRFDKQKFDVIANIPVLDDRLALRLSGSYEDFAGFQFNTFKQQTEADRRRTAFGLKARYQPLPQLELTLNARLSETEVAGLGWGETSFMSDDLEQIIRTYRDPEFNDILDRRMSTDFDDGTRTEASIMSGRAKWSFRSGYELMAVLSQTNTLYEFDLDVDYTPVPGSYLDPYAVDTDTVTGEVRLTSPIGLFDGRFQFVGGLFANQTEDYAEAVLIIGPTDDLVVSLTDPGISPVLDLVASAGVGDAATIVLSRARSLLDLAAYVQGTWSVTDRFDLISGIRYAHVAADIDLITTEDFGGTGFSGPVTVGSLLGIGTGTYRGLNRVDENLSAKLSARYHLTDDVMVYLTAAQGFKPGGYSVLVPTDGPNEFEEETSLTYEAGVKAGLLDGLGRIALTAFWTDYDNLQVLVPIGANDIEANAADARARGVEMESQWVLPLGFIAKLNAAYLDARFLSYPDGPCPDGSSDAATGTDSACDLSGGVLPQAPEWNGALILDGSWQLGSWPIHLSLGFDALYQDLVTFQVDGDLLDSMSAYWMYNARIALAGDSERWRISAHLHNITDELVSIYGGDNEIFAGSHYRVLAPPRRASVELFLSF